MSAPTSRAGENITCPTCAAVPGERCVSRTGRILKTTHDNRFRAARQAARDWYAEQMARRFA